ncbi:hypothetical protein CWI39_3730p0010 [Hamiltosporidium magnivora]|uniref:Uncharacterized protein n=1 Tax=Hamiltosporidium magnivora TaxID=148818 RepID=A0A4Q9KPG8_9MICR|nr:hypothetical protein CWI39_3730p0010 [Hamiltosporidium magnivora]
MSLDDIETKYQKTFLKRLQISYGCRGIHPIDSVYDNDQSISFDRRRKLESELKS